MNALDSLLADIRAAHTGQKVARRPTACPQGQTARPAKPRQPAAARPAPIATQAAPQAKPAAAENPIIARALATLRAELAKVTP